MSLPISGNVPTSAGSVLRAFPASHGPYDEKIENPETWKNQQNQANPPLYSALFRRFRVPWLAY